MLPDGLIYYPDSQPGISRRRCGRGFSYRAPDGTTIADTDMRRRIDALAVPPAYNHVWISPRLNGHLQATGYDAATRKQYRYHPDWTRFRANRKFEDLPRFGHALPRLRAAIRTGLEAEPGSRDFVLAAVLGLIDRLSLRPGHPDYAEANGSFGATTLRSRHLLADEDGTRLRFLAKGGQKVSKTLRDKTLARALHKLDDLPGAPIATWLEGDEVRTVSPDMLASFMADVTGEDGLTPKTFRTWNGSVAAMDVALSNDDLTISAMADAAAKRLNNTPTMARNSYIHPEVIALSETEPDVRKILADATTPTRLRRSERALLNLIG
ncbi:DNA topoisomerase IB [Jannaschia sp. CCS1]|uniref:DNA topoisomerase IB n=1 Tax=Jannaschia sp. (strain CCS1) TaxID=290400 RepID=UPI000053AFD5|nr:DNA topoisomerase IB [Jannaschia sp. CCS1]ABD53195.1 putative DNA topoisomerase I protein [Jannaschia sp. CCS1]